MKASQVALSGLGTLAVVGYLVATEYPFWKKWTDDDKPTRSRSVSKGKSKSGSEDKRDDDTQANESNTRSSSSNTTGEAGSNGTGSEAGDTGATAHRSGHVAYWVDMDCDCQLSYNMLLESVELTAEHTILTIFNASQEEVAAYPPGHDKAQFLLEWRYVDNDRPRHNLTELRGIPTYPESGRPLHFQLVFPRIADVAQRFQVSGQATTKLDYFKYASVRLEEEVSLDELAKRRAYGRCGFDGLAEMPRGKDKVFAAHTGPGRSAFSWSTSPGLSIQGSSRKDEVKVRGKDTGQGEVCLEARVDGVSCRSCQPVNVVASAEPLETDFRMKTCGGIPSKDPHWQFEITEPISGASYEWQVEGGNILSNSETKKTMIMRPRYRPGPFTVTLNVAKGGTKRAYTREFHNIYSCLERDD